MTLDMEQQRRWVQQIARIVMPSEKPVAARPQIKDGVFFHVDLHIQGNRYIVAWDTLLTALNDPAKIVAALELSVSKHGWAGLFGIKPALLPANLLPDYVLEAAGAAPDANVEVLDWPASPDFDQLIGDPQPPTVKAVIKNYESPDALREEMLKKDYLDENDILAIRAQAAKDKAVETPAVQGDDLDALDKLIEQVESGDATPAAPPKRSHAKKVTK